MSYQLFYAERSAAMGVRVLLEELKVDYQLIQEDIQADTRSPEMLKHNPNGWVPVLIWGDQSMYECGAIFTFLCDRHTESKLAPQANDTTRGKFLQWLVFFSSSIQNAYQMSYYPYRFCDQESHQPAVQRRSITRLKELWQVVDDAIGDNEWLLGDEFSAADIYMFMISTWISEERCHPSISTFPNVHRITEKVGQRPSVQMVYQSYFSNAE